MKTLTFLIFIMVISGCAIENKTLTQNDSFILGAETMPHAGFLEMTNRSDVIDPIKQSKPLTTSELAWIIYDVKKRFTYKDDNKNKKHNYVDDYWIDFNQSRVSWVMGDCEDFAQMIRAELYDRGHNSKLITISINGDETNHVGVLYNDFVIDNWHSYPMRKSELVGYHFIAASGYGNDKVWRTVK